MFDKAAQTTLRMRYKQAVHQKPTLDALNMAIKASDAMRGGGMPADKALLEAERWLFAHGKGPSLQEWRELAQLQRDMLSSTTFDIESQFQLFQMTHFLVGGLQNWRRHLRSLPQLLDFVVGGTIPILSQAEAVPVSMKLCMLQKVEELLAHSSKTPQERCRLAELRVMRGKWLLTSQETEEQNEGQQLLQQQVSLLARLAQQGVTRAAKLHTEAQTLLAAGE